jgi:hypothetical protein
MAEYLSAVGKMDSQQRRLERWLANPRIGWQQGCQCFADWVLRCWQGEQLVLLVDETQLGNQLSVMVVGLGYSIGLGCYPLKAWPDGQVALIDRLLSWIAPSVPVGHIPLVQADRGIGTSPDLMRAVEQRGWHYLFRVQNQTHMRTDAQPECALRAVLHEAGTEFSATGHVFKKAGWLKTTIHILWGAA